MQPLLSLALFPNIHYCTCCVAADAIWLEACENYHKRSFRNRFQIVNSHGIQVMSVPLKKGKNSQMPIQEVEIAYDENWPVHFSRSIRSAYGKAPYFEYYYDELHTILNARQKFLWELNLQGFQFLKKHIFPTTPVYWTKKYEAIPANLSISDQRNLIKAGNQALSSGEALPISYPQVFESLHGFLPNLSALDMLFCTGPEARLLLRRFVDDHRAK